MSAVEISTVGSTATGTASSSSRAENGGLSEVDPTAEFCPSCGWTHQERERAVRCLRCRMHFTVDYHAICDSCRSREASP